MMDFLRAHQLNIMLSLLVKYRNSFRRLILYPLILFAIVPILASFAQIKAYGLSLTNMSIVGMAVIDYLKKQQKSM